MDPYSLLLASAMALTAAAVVLGWVVRRSTAARRAALVGAATTLAALLVHLRWGHTPGTATGMGPSAFVGEHPALFATLLIASGLAVRLRAKGDS